MLTVLFINYYWSDSQPIKTIQIPYLSYNDWDFRVLSFHRRSSNWPSENIKCENVCRLPSPFHRDDLVQVGPGPGNHTLTVRTINVGLTLLAVQVRGIAGLADFVPIPVEQAIHPAEAQRLVVGDVVCFSVQLTSPDGEASACCSQSHTLARIHTGVGKFPAWPS